MADGFIWYELMTDDQDAAIAFYEAVVGWSARDMTIPEMGDYRYTILNAGERGIAGLAVLPEELAGLTKPGWFGYVHVADTDAAAAAIVAAGGTVHMEPDDIPSVGRFAMVADPTGAAFYLLSPLPREDAPAPLPRMSRGNCGWHELHAGDGDAAFRFYGRSAGPKSPWTWSRWEHTAVAVRRERCVTDNIPQMSGRVLFYFFFDGVDARPSASAGRGTVIKARWRPGRNWIVQADPQARVRARLRETRRSAANAEDCPLPLV